MAARGGARSEGAGQAEAASREERTGMVRARALVAAGAVRVVLEGGGPGAWRAEVEAETRRRREAGKGGRRKRQMCRPKIAARLPWSRPTVISSRRL